MMTAEEIQNVREYWGLSCADMSRILGFGPNQWRLYEQGEAPSKSNGLLIMITIIPSSFLSMLNNVPQFQRELMGKRYEKVLKRAIEAVERVDADVNMYRLSVERRYVLDMIVSQRRKEEIQNFRL